VVEAGAGAGTLAVAVLAAAPACAPALRYVLVDRSEPLRARHTDHLAIEPPTSGLGPHGEVDPDEAPAAVPGAGPLVMSLADLPAPPATGVVLANELLDNMGFALLERRPHGWAEVRVAARDDDGFDEVLVEAPDPVAEAAGRLAPEAAVGARIPLQRQAGQWLRQALGLLERGRVVVVDYADTTPSLARRPSSEWVRTYRSHGRGGHPLDDPGSQDVTCEVAADQLALIARPSSDRTQADFLRSHGIDALVEEGRRVWEERGHLGDLAALKARSRVREADALLDPGGLGGFRVLEWDA
jgi:SAM-dependent MidA family methyltransferase